VADRFLAVLARARLTATLRRPRGSDIAAACGQLALRADGGDALRGR
jgi:adenine C2-methylase RlmN of 23S rRNA A2503 and tRNA A37